MKEAWGGVIALIFILFVILPAGRAIDAALPQPVAVASAQVTTLCELRFDPPVEGVLVCWQNRCFETDARGIWKHSITVTAGQCQWYEFVITEGDVVVEGARGPSNAYVMLMSDKRIRFRFNSTPGAQSGPFVLSVTVPTPTATRIPSPTATNSPVTPVSSPTPGPSPTTGPTAQPTLGPNDSLPWTIQCAVAQAALDRMWDRRRPPVSLVDLRASAVWAVANLHTGILHVWAQDPGVPWGASSNWRIEPGAPLTDEFTVETPYGTATVIGFCNGVFFRLGMRYYAMQWSACALSELQPDMVWVSREEAQ